MAPLAPELHVDLLALAGEGAGWTLLHAGHNALYRSSDGMRVVKLYGAVSRAWLDADGAARAAAAGARVPEILAVPHPNVVVWRCVEARPHIASDRGAVRDLAASLDAIRSVPASSDANWLTHLDQRIALLAERVTDDGVVTWLVEQLQAARDEAGRLAPTLVFQHGDLSSANLVHDGRFHVVDFETVRSAPPEWDVACLGVSTRRSRTFDGSTYNALIDALDVPPDDEVLACCTRIKELLNTSWLYLTHTAHPAVAAELRARVASLRAGVDHEWRELAQLGRNRQPNRRS